MDNIKFRQGSLDERSNEVKEILGKVPSWVIRFGITAIFFVVLIILISSALISYNDIITADITITTKNPPIYLKTNSSGKLNRVFVEADQKVETGQILAEIENPAIMEDVIFLKQNIDSFSFDIQTLDSLYLIYPPGLNLGQIQESYGRFLTQFQNYILNNSLAPNKNERAILLSQLKEQKSFLNNQERQLILFQEDLEFSKNNYDRNSKLYKRGVISKAEFEDISRAYLSDKQKFEMFQTDISNTKIEITNLNGLITKSSIQGSQVESNNKQELEKSMQALNNTILLWENNFLVISPIEGKVTLFDIWTKYQNVSEGKVLFTILPNKLEKIIGRASVPVKNSGKVKRGQKVIVKLTNYPFEEWGSLKGKIDTVSEVPVQDQKSFYVAYITLDDFKTSYGKEIVFQQDMQGTVDIVVEELSILQRIMYQVTRVFSR